MAPIAKRDDKRPRRGSRARRGESEKRLAHGHAVRGLNAHSAGVANVARGELGVGGLGDSMRELAATIDSGELGVPRLLVLDSLVKLARRPARNLDDEGEALDELLHALVRDAGVPDAEREPAVRRVRRALESVQRLAVVAPQAHPWTTFARQAAGPLRLTRAEVDKPRCNDREVVRKGARKAVGITVEFVTDAAPGEMSVCDPTTWHECTASFREMEPWNDPNAVDENRADGWRRDLVERVELLPGKLLETPLRFTYSIDQASDPAWAHLDYVLVEETSEIAVDEGSIDVRRITLGPHAGRTRVSTKKAILFKDPVLSDWMTVACDTFWTDLVVHAAVGCLGGAEQAPANEGGEPEMTDSTDALTKAIEEAASAAQKSVQAYAQLAKQAIERLGGDEAGDTAGWIQLTTKAYAQAANDTARAWSTYNEVLAALAESGNREPDG